MVVLSISLSWGLSAMLTQQIRRDEGQALQVVAQSAAQVLAEELDSRSREVQVLAQAQELWLQGLESATVKAALARSQASNPWNTWIGVADGSGQVRAATGGLMVGRNASDRPWFEPGSKGIYVGDVHPAKMLAASLPPLPNGEPLRFVDFAAPIRVDGKWLGVLVTHGSWQWADQMVQSLAPGNAAERQLETFIFDRGGKMIYAPAGTLAQQLARQQTVPPAPADPKAAPAGVTRWNDGQDYLTAVVPVKPLSTISNLGWTVVSREPVSTAFAQARSQAWTVFDVGLLAAALSALLAWWVAGRLTRPLSRIAESARALEQGAPGAAMPVLSGSTEVAQLSGALSAMTQRLLDLNHQLEERVLQRTAELERANEELSRLALVDPLTLLLNRRGFDEQSRLLIAQARRKQQPLSLVTIDADHFKRVNDSFGHEAGDRALKVIADTMRQRLRASDVLGRLGGEEFMALLPDTDAEQALALADELRELVAGTTIAEVGQITISCGVTLLDPAHDDMVSALRRADQSLYRAKAEGRNRVCVA
nr:diguanylate cyclase [uncultured Roseateles sp.]